MHHMVVFLQSVLLCGAATFLSSEVVSQPAPVDLAAEWGVPLAVGGQGFTRGGLPGSQVLPGGLNRSVMGHSAQLRLRSYSPPDADEQRCDMDVVVQQRQRDFPNTLPAGGGHGLPLPSNGGVDGRIAVVPAALLGCPAFQLAVGVPVLVTLQQQGLVVHILSRHRRRCRHGPSRRYLRRSGGAERGPAAAGSFRRGARWPARPRSSAAGVVVTKQG